MIGDGKTLSITHVGTIKLKTKFGLYILKNVLCVPLLKKNLKLIQCMSRDLNCEFILNAFGFLEKDKGAR